MNNSNESTTSSKQRKLDHTIPVHVSCGGYSATVQAHSLLEAFELFLDKEQPEALGILCEFKTTEWSTDDDTFYSDTVKMLEDLDRLSEE